MIPRSVVAPRRALALSFLLASGLGLVAALPRSSADEPRPADPKGDDGKPLAPTSPSPAAPASPTPAAAAPVASPVESANLRISPRASNDRRKKLEEAIAAFKAAEAHLRKEGYRAARADLEAAGKLLRARRAEDLSDPLPLYYLGIVNQLETDDRHAIENLQGVVKMAPGFHEAWTELGDAYTHLGDYKNAEAAYAKALEVKPDYLEALKNRILERLDAGNYAEGRDDVKRGLALSPGDVWFLALDRKLAAAIDGPKWSIRFEKETDNYVVRTNVDQLFADSIAGKLELIRKVYVKLFEKTKIDAPKRKYLVWVFANRKEYQDWGGPPTAGGHYDPQVRQLFCFKYPKDEDLQMVLFHEGFHQFLHPYLPVAPQWFNEGTADYFGATKQVKVPEEGLKIVPNWWRLPMIKQGIAGGKMPTMKQLMLMSRAELYDPKTVGMNYAQAWSIIYFLCEYENRKYFSLLGKYFASLRAGKDLEGAFKAAFGDQDMAKLDKEWRAFISSLS